MSTKRPPSAVRQRRRVLRILVILALTPPLGLLELRPDTVLSMRFSADGRYIESSHKSGPAQVWEVATGRRISSPGKLGEFPLGSGGGAPVPGCPFAAGAEDRDIVLLFHAGQHSIRLRGHSRPVTAVALSPGCTHVASGGADGTMRLWSVASGKELWSARGYPTGVAWRVLRVQPSSFTELLVVIVFLSVYIGLFVFLRSIVAGPVHSLSVGLHGQTLAVTNTADVFLLDCATGRELWSRMLATFPLERSVPRRAVLFLDRAANPEAPALAETRGVALFRSVESGEVLRRVRGPGAWTGTVSQDGRLAAFGGLEGNVLVEVATGQVRGLQGHKGAFRSLAFSPDGILLASGGHDNRIRLWDTTTGKERAVLTGHDRTVTCLAFSPDSSLLASGSEDSTLRLWDAAAGAERTKLEGHTGPVTWVAFSPDGRFVASCGADKTMRLWEAATGKELRRMEGHTKKVNTLALSPDGSFLVSGGDDKTVRAWDTSSGAQLWQLTARRVGIFGYRFERS